MFVSNVYAQEARHILSDGRIIHSFKDKKYNLSWFRVIYNENDGEYYALYTCALSDDTAWCKELKDLGLMSNSLIK